MSKKSIGNERIVDEEVIKKINDITMKLREDYYLEFIISAFDI